LIGLQSNKYVMFRHSKIHSDRFFEQKSRQVFHLSTITADIYTKSKSMESILCISFNNVYEAENIIPPIYTCM